MLLSVIEPTIGSCLNNSVLSPYQAYCLPLNLMVKRAKFLSPEPDVYSDVN